MASLNPAKPTWVLSGNYCKLMYTLVGARWHKRSLPNYYAIRDTEAHFKDGVPTAVNSGKSTAETKTCTSNVLGKHVIQE